MIDKYISKEVSDGVAFLYLDQQDSKVNIVSPSLIDVFDQIIDQINLNEINNYASTLFDPESLYFMIVGKPEI